MKKMNFASVSCEIAVADNFYFSTESICEYGRDTVRYAFLRKKHRTPEKMHLGELENPGGKRK